MGGDLLFLLVSFIFLSIEVSGIQTDNCGVPAVTSFDEGPTLGDAVYNFTGNDNLSLDRANPDVQREYFSLANNTLFAAKNLTMDVDTDLCATSMFHMKVLCERIGDSAVDFSVEVMPVDNYDPEFPQTEYQVHIPESTPNGDQIFNFDEDNTTRASDRDCQGEISYYGVENENVIGVDNAQKGTIVTKRLFDYENNDRDFTINVTAYPSSGSRHGYTKIILIIDDVDDQDPAFSNDNYELKVPEQNTSLLGQWMEAEPPVHAYDKDVGINTTLAYKINSLIPSLSDLFINNDTGQLMVNTSLDREAVSSYTVELEAYQIDDPRRAARSTLHLVVEDINDNRPFFNTTNYDATVQEHAPSGSNIILVSAVDKDAWPNNVFNYTLDPGSDIFKIDPQTGYLQVLNSTALDRETQDTFSITVSTTEQRPPAPGSPNCTVGCTATVNVTLLDINDHSPVFSQNSYSFSSSNEASTLIGTVNATDDDTGDNGRVQYTIVQSSDFSIVHDTSNIVQDNVIASQNEVVLLVQACDAGVSSRCTSVFVKVTFPDQNVTSITAYVNVTENVAIGTTVYVIPAAYSGFTLVPNSNAFQIDTTDALQVVTAADIDRENTSSYTLVIDVNKGGTTEANITLEVVVLDVNDNAPIFNMSDYSFSIPDNVAIGHTVGVVSAYDLDDGANGDVTFSIKGTESSLRFHIDEQSGTITLNVNLQSSNEIVIVATDGGAVPLKTTTVVTVVVAGAQNAYTLFHAPAEKDEVEKDKDRLVGEISAILNISIDIGTIQSVDVDNGASSYFHLTARESTVHMDDLRSKVNSNYDELLALFSRYQSKSEEVFTTPFIALLAVGIAVAVVSVIIIIAIVYINRKRNRHHKRLMRNLSKHDTIYEAQAVEETIGDGQSVHSQTGSTQELLEEGPHANGDAIAVLNEGFEDDDNNNTKAGDENQDTLTQYTHVEEEAEEGGMTEGVIVDFGPEDTPEQEHVETQGLPNPDYGDGEEVIFNPDYAVVDKKEALETKTALLVIEDEDIDEDVHEHIDGEKDEEVPSREGDQILEPPQEDEIPPPPVKEDEDRPDLYVNESIEDEDEDTGDGFPPPPPTPPRVRKSDPEDEEPYEAQDEPEPDYAKKVRFSEVRVQVIPDPKDEDAVESGVAGEGTEGAETDEEDHTTKSDRPFEEIQNPAEDIDEGDGTFIMTAL